MTSFGICTNGIVMTVVGISVGTFILIEALAFPATFVETGLAFACTVQAKGVFKRTAVGINGATSRVE